MKTLFTALVVILGFFSVAFAATNRTQVIIDCNARPQLCAGNPSLMNGNLRNIGQPGMTARISGLSILQGLCTSLGVSCGGSYDTASLQARIRQLQYMQSMQEEMRRNEAANLARMNEARRLADEASAAAAARAAAAAQSANYEPAVIEMRTPQDCEGDLQRAFTSSCSNSGAAAAYVNCNNFNSQLSSNVIRLPVITAKHRADLSACFAAVCSSSGLREGIVCARAFNGAVLGGSRYH